MCSRDAEFILTNPVRNFFCKHFKIFFRTIKFEVQVGDCESIFGNICSGVCDQFKNFAKNGPTALNFDFIAVKFATIFYYLIQKVKKNEEKTGSSKEISNLS